MRCRSDIFTSIAGFILCLLLTILTGCESSDDVRVVNLGGTATPNTPGEAMWLTFQERAQAASGERMQLKPLIYGQLGSEEQLLSGLRRGRIQFANLSAQATSTVVPELALLYAPYLFTTESEADFVYDKYLTEIYRELLAAQGLHLVTWYEIGFHSVYGTKPLILPTDAAGTRFRVSSSVNARLFAQAIGADVIPLGYGEIVSSLQTGLIDAGENSIALYARTGIADEAPHFTLTEHAFGMSVIVTDQLWWDSLAVEERKILEESFPSIKESRLATRAQNIQDLSDPALGIQIHELTAAQKEQWERTVAPVTKVLIETIGGRSGEIYELIQRGRAEYASMP